MQQQCFSTITVTGLTLDACRVHRRRSHSRGRIREPMWSRYRRRSQQIVLTLLRHPVVAKRDSRMIPCSRRNCLTRQARATLLRLHRALSQAPSPPDRIQATGVHAVGGHVSCAASMLPGLAFCFLLIRLARTRLEMMHCNFQLQPTIIASGSANILPAAEMSSPTYPLRLRTKSSLRHSADKPRAIGNHVVG
jgi:hypothetical protein